MNVNELRAYAVRGLTSRLAELDREREAIVTLLADLTGNAEPATPVKTREMTPEGRKRIGDAARRRWAARRAAAPASPPPASAEPETNEARVLPRRNRLVPRNPPPATEPALPPMPRLVKASPV